ncbi:MAG: glycosyltransferase [Polyangiales bacterium]
MFAVARDDDPALPVARAACEALRSADIDARVSVTGARGVNQKASQLAAVIADVALHDVVVVIDSDVDCGAIDLDALVAPLSRDPSLAAVWAPVVEAAGSTLADRASEAVLAGSLHAALGFFHGSTRAEW